MYITLNDAAELICKIERRPDKPYVLRQLKAAYAAKFISPEDNNGPRGAGRYSPTEICKARLLLAAIRGTTDSTTIVAAFEDKRFAFAMAQMEGDASWNLVVSTVTLFDTAELGHTFVWERIGADGTRDRGTSGYADPTAPETESVGGTIEEVKVYRFTNLCRPLWQALTETGRG